MCRTVPEKNRNKSVTFQENVTTISGSDFSFLSGQSSFECCDDTFTFAAKSTPNKIIETMRHHSEHNSQEIGDSRPTSLEKRADYGPYTLTMPCNGTIRVTPDGKVLLRVLFYSIVYMSIFCYMSCR